MKNSDYYYDRYNEKDEPIFNIPGFDIDLDKADNKKFNSYIKNKK